MRVLSGIQPTGDIHVGNYVGAIRHWVAGQHDQDAFIFIADLHALTVPRDPAEVRDKTLEAAMVLLASGIDPETCTLFVQSHVPEVSELGWLLNCVATTGELSRMTQYKEKAKGKESVTVGLFDYPVLQAADILVYGADRVPVGDEQRQHVELCRDIAIRFNGRYGDTFVVPEVAIAKVGARIMDLQRPTNKMSKSASSPQGLLVLLEPPESMTRKIMRAVTDAETEVRYDREAKPGVSNLLELLAVAPGGDPHALAGRYERYGDLKSDTAAAVVEFLRPVQERFAEVAADPAGVVKILDRGAEQARSVAAGTLARAKAAMGLLPR
ncbi:MAG TPA: tryptophan--tRNA ligase [Acidimicrobiales bacterium]|nr:tryptophan--tRNA ligase [Acidimicrobiales bacterium]